MGSLKNNLFSFFNEWFDDWLSVDFVGWDFDSLEGLRFSVSGVESLGWVNFSLWGTLDEFGVDWVSFSDDGWFRYDSLSDWLNNSLSDDFWFSSDSLFDDFWFKGGSLGEVLSLSYEVLGWNSVEH